MAAGKPCRREGLAHAASHALGGGVGARAHLVRVEGDVKGPRLEILLGEALGVDDSTALRARRNQSSSNEASAAAPASSCSLGGSHARQGLMSPGKRGRPAHNVDGALQHVQRERVRHGVLPGVQGPGVQHGDHPPEAQGHKEGGAEGLPVVFLEGRQERDAQRAQPCTREGAADGRGKLLNASPGTCCSGMRLWQAASTAAPGGPCGWRITPSAPNPAGPHPAGWRRRGRTGGSRGSTGSLRVGAGRACAHGIAAQDLG